MKLYILLIVFISNIGLALSYSEKDIRLSDYEYNRYVKNGLKDIIKEYFALYQSLNPEIQNSYTQFTLHSKIRDSFRKISKTKEVEEILLEIQNTKKTSFELLQANTQYYNLLDKKHFSKTETLLHFSDFENYKNALFNFHLSFQKASTLANSLELKKFINKRIEKHLELESLFFSFLSSASDNRFKNEFSAFENDFIRPVQKYILPAPNKKNFIARINQLNLSITKLNVALTKRNKVISKQSKSLIKTYHTRWNNILKVTLRR